ncbi:MAG: mechanosensitive ion channel family protein, partial [Saprospiraceae bacterium]
MQSPLLNNLQYFLTFGGIILATILIAFLINRFFIKSIRRSTKVLKNDPTNYQFVRHAAVGIIYLFGFSLAIYTIPSLRTL